MKGRGEAVRAAARVLDEQICASLDAELHAEFEERMRIGAEPARMLELRQQLGDLPDDVDGAIKQMTDFADKVFGNLQIHRCLMSSCGKPPRGKCGCRFAMPRASGPQYDETRPYFFVARRDGAHGHTISMELFEDDFDRHDEDIACVLVIWELKRPDKRDGCVVEGNKLLAYLYASNTNTQHLGGEDVLIGIARYVVGYCSKNLVKVTNVLATIRQLSHEAGAPDGTATSE